MLCVCVGDVMDVFRVCECYIRGMLCFLFVL